jgi:hypothetical protein
MKKAGIVEVFCFGPIRYVKTGGRFPLTNIHGGAILKANIRKGGVTVSTGTFEVVEACRGSYRPR